MSAPPSADDPQPPPRPGSYERLVRVFPWVFLGIAAAVQVVLALLPLEVMVDRITLDDTFLYLQVAYNWGQSGLPSFDGETLTNGIQPLWGILLAALASICPDKVLLLRLTCLLCATCNLLTAPLLYRLGVALASRAVGRLALVAWCTYLLFPASIDGMEPALHGLVFSAAMLVAARVWRSLPSPSATRMSGLALALSLNGFARLDSGMVSAFVALAFAVALIRARRPTLLFPLFGLPVLLLGGYLLANQLAIGVPTPMSGRAKFYWAHEAVTRGFGAVLETGLIGTVQAWAGSLLRVSGASGTRSLFHLGLLGILLAVALWRAFRRGQLDPLLVGLVVVLVLHALLVNLLLQQFGTAYWYYQPQRIVGCLLVGHLVWLPLTRPLRIAGVAALCSLAAVTSVRYLDDYDPHSMYVDRLRTARWIASTDRLPADAVIGSWNAGTLAYFCGRQVVNLDGLVQGAGFIDEVLRPGAWKSYFRRRGIRYLVDYNGPDLTQAHRQRTDADDGFRGVVAYDEVTVVHRIGYMEVLALR